MRPAASSSNCRRNTRSVVVVLAPYEGFDKATYDQLSAVAYPDKTWQTTWQDQTKLIGQALGKSDEATELIDGMNTMLTDTAAAHPEYAGKTLSVINLGTANGQVNVYKPTDPRVQILTQLDFVNSPGVEKLAASSDPDNYFVDISAEHISEVDADVVVVFVPDAAEAEKNPAYASLGAVKRGTAVAPRSDTKIIAGLSQTSVRAHLVGDRPTHPAADGSGEQGRATPRDFNRPTAHRQPGAGTGSDPVPALGRRINLGCRPSVGHPAFDTRLNSVERPLVRIDIRADDPVVERPEPPNKLRALENKRNEMPDQRVPVDRNPANSFDHALEFIDCELWG
ncbi:substrate-binding family protein [Rhodococcus sp. AG1013]|uniref:ABC transporter substrate-binding protein n=1 Tax=Rhodococcus sp. AG1013 TaxID=2183996 RepID=UPI000E2B4D61|nr:ABC transporter substrate-binding protein [Rhodococcus sp. AG1013]RDI16201.1 substrate-binding family protein [Rhodococcus sp. AG1013]